MRSSCRPCRALSRRAKVKGASMTTIRIVERLGPVLTKDLFPLYHYLDTV